MRMRRGRRALPDLQQGGSARDAARLQGRHRQEGPAALCKGGWSRAFDDPIPLPRGRELVTLRDAIAWLAKLPKARHNYPDIQHAARLVTEAAERGGILMMAEIAVRRAIGHARRCPN
jgi:hypothetical protein